MDRRDALDAFLAVLNTVRPDHPCFADPYPLERDDVAYGVTRSVSASCGPRSGPLKAAYSTRMTFINRIDRPRHLAVLTHEVTHITYGRGRGREAGGHPPEFWREMAFHTLELRDAINDGVLDNVFGSVDSERYLAEVANQPNRRTVDRRYWSVEECRAELRQLLGLD